MNHDGHGDGRTNRCTKATGRVADTLHKAALVARVPHLHRSCRGGERACFTHAECEANPPQRIKASSERSKHSDDGAVRHDGGKNSSRTEAVTEPSTGHLEERIGPDEGAENNAHGDFAETVLF